MARETVEDVVYRGIALLDKKKPTWRNNIDLKTLDLGNVRQCVLGEVYGDYSTGLDRLAPRRGWYGRNDFAESHGFDIGPLAHSRRESYLTRVWKRVLRREGIGTE